MNPPSKFGRFEVIGELGKGAMGVVYKAKDPVIDREVAIKTLSPEGREDPDLYERFTREARSAGILHHRNIITVYDVGEEDGIPFLALEYLEGRNLQELVEQEPDLSLADKVELIKQIGEGLHYAHERGVIHRDIKPENVMVLSDGTVKITDFGIARSETTDKTKPGVVLGSVGYMAPEQIKGQSVDRRADIFALGIVAYELLTGRRAFPGENIPTVMGQILNSNPPVPTTVKPDLPEVVDRIIAKALAKNREERYATAEEFVQDLVSIVPHGEEKAVLFPSREGDEEDEITLEEIFGESEFEEPEEERPVRTVSPLFWLFAIVTVAGIFLASFIGYMQYTSWKANKLAEAIQEHFEAAEGYMQAGEYEKAILRYQAILELDKTNPDAMAMMGRAEGLQEQRSSIPPLREQLKIAMDAGNLEAAMEINRQILKLNPNDTEAKVSLADIEEKIKTEEEVKEFLTLASEEFETGHYEEALKLYEEVIARDSGNKEARAAIEKIKQRLFDDPKLNEMKKEADDHLAKGEYAQAIALYEEILRVQPERDDLREKIEMTRGEATLAAQMHAWRRSAVRHYEEGEYEQSIQDWRQILKYRPFDLDALEGLKKAEAALQN